MAERSSFVVVANRLPVDRVEYDDGTVEQKAFAPGYGEFQARAKDELATVDPAPRADDHAAFAELYRAHAGRVYALCLRLEGDVQRAEELAHGLEQGQFFTMFSDDEDVVPAATAGSWRRRSRSRRTSTSATTPSPTSTAT